MNLQNIPSHATDIRHMFRATASRRENYDCQLDESTSEISVEVSKFDSVYTSDNVLIKVYNLKEGDLVAIQQGTARIMKTLKSILEVRGEPCRKILVLV